MRWIAKALAQKGLSALFESERLNYLLQRYVTRSLPRSEASFKRRFCRATQHVRAYREHGPEKPLGDASFYEFGAGWDLAVPLSLWSLGVERQTLVDIRRNVRTPLVEATFAATARAGGRQRWKSPRPGRCDPGDDRRP